MKSVSILLGFGLIALGACSSGPSSSSDGKTALSPGDARNGDDGGSTSDAGSGEPSDAGGHDAGANPVPLGQVGAATDGTQALFVWTGGAQPGVHGARVAEDGTILGSVTFPSAPSGSQGIPAAGYDGQRFLVTWIHDPQPGEPAAHGARVSRQGQTLDSQPLILGSAAGLWLEGYGPGMTVAGEAGTFAVGWNSGARFVETWVDGCSGTVQPATVYAAPDQVVVRHPAAVLSNGSLTTLCGYFGPTPGPGPGGPKIPVGKVGGCHDYPWEGNPNGGYTHSGAPALAYGGNTLAQVWTFQDKFSTTLQEIQGRIGERAFSFPVAVREVKVGFDGTYFHLVWLTDYNGHLMEQRIGVDGTLVDSPVTIGPAEAKVADGISVACPGTTCMVGFHDDAGIGVIRLTGAAPGTTGRIALAAAP